MGSKVAMSVAHILGPLLFPLLLWDLPCCHVFLCGDQVVSRSCVRGWGEPAEALTPSGLLDDFLLGDGGLGDGRGGLDDRGDGSWQELVGLGP